MNENHEKTGLAAFLLSLAAIITLGLAVIPALICALISKRQSEMAGKPTDGFATASIVVCGFVLLFWAVVIIGGGALMLGNGFRWKLPEIGMGEIQALLFLCGGGVAITAVLMIAHRRAARVRLLKLAGRR